MGQRDQLPENNWIGRIWTRGKAPNCGYQRDSLQNAPARTVRGFALDHRLSPIGIVGETHEQR